VPLELLILALDGIKLTAGAYPVPVPNMSRYVPPSKRSSEKPTLDPAALTSEAHFPILSLASTSKASKTGFKEVIEERLRQEAEDAIRAAAPIDIRSLSAVEREVHGVTTLKISGNTYEELAAISEKLYASELRRRQMEPLWW